MCGKAFMEKIHLINNDQLSRMLNEREEQDSGKVRSRDTR